MRDMGGWLSQAVAGEDHDSKFPRIAAVHCSLKNQKICTSNLKPKNEVIKVFTIYSIKTVHKMGMFVQPGYDVAFSVSG